MNKEDYETREAQLAQLRPMTVAFRKVTEGFFPNPDPYSSLLYAVTELGEALSAWLREQRPDDVRANKGEAVADELCDAIMMLHGVLAPDARVGEARVINIGTEREIANSLSILSMLVRMGWQEDVGQIYAKESALYIGNLLYDLCGAATAETYRLRLAYRLGMACKRAGMTEDQAKEIYSQWSSMLATELASI